MIYRFIFVSDEVDNFYREVQIDSEASFVDFHKAILESVGYPDDQMTSFFICEDNWEKREEITREEMNTSSEIDNWVMESTLLSELIEEEKQRLIYVFDPPTDRCFFIELKEISYGKSLDKAVCTGKGGEAPQQTIDFDAMTTSTTQLDIDENFYGDEDFDSDDLDADGFDMGGGGDVTIDSLDDLY